MAKPKNLLYAFAVRILLVLLANGVLWTIVVKLYYQHTTSHQTINIVREELLALEPLINEVAYKDRVQFKAFLEENMRKNEIPFLEVFRKGEGVIFSEGRASLPPKYQQFPDQLTRDSSPDYELFESNRQHFLYLFTPVFEPGWYMRTAVPVNPIFATQIQNTTQTVIAVVILTLLQVAILLFPLMLAAYNRALKDRANLLMSHLWTVLALGNAIAKRDSDTDTHNYRVSYYALRLAEKVGLAPEKIPGLIKGAFLHDVGKIGVPDSVLLKPGSLTDAEHNIVQKHVSDGLEIIAGIPWLRDAAPVISGHHEHYDGQGYPDGLIGEAIPLEARIFSVVDVFDALTSRRPYKEAMTLDSALNIMDKASGKQFDPEVYRTFRTLAPTLLKRVPRDDRHRLRRLLSHAILPYFHHILGDEKRINTARKS